MLSIRRMRWSIPAPLMPPGGNNPGSKEIAERLAGKVREFNGSRAEDAWLLAAWEGSNDDWSFRYFTIGHCHVKCSNLDLVISV